MQIKQYVFTLLFLSFSLFKVTANNDNHKNDDTISVHRDGVIIENDFDSLLNLWYVQQENNSDLLDFSVLDSLDSNTVKIPMFSDSIYEARLKQIPSLIELPYNEKVRAFIELYTMRKREQVERMLGLSEYYFPIFEEILDMKKMPVELRYLPVIESALNPNAVSKMGATGLWQFMFRTGRMYKLEINSFVDERRDPIKASYAAASFLSDLYNIYHDWILVIAAYNCGPGNVNKAIKRSGGVKNYWKIYYNLPRETRGYVPAFIAATYALTYYKEHNLVPRKLEMPLAIDTIMVDEELHLSQVAEMLTLPIELLRNLNPEYIKDILPAKTKTYSLKLPVEYTTRFIERSDTIFAHKDSLFFGTQIAEIPKLGTCGTVASSSSEPPTSNHTAIYYTVKSGDNIGYISSWFSVSINQIRTWNHIRRNLIRSGQKLLIYVPSNKESFYKKVNSMSFAEKQKIIGKDIIEQSEVVSNMNTNNSNSTEEYIYYTVKSGDNLLRIASKFEGVTYSEIMQLNGISNAKSLSPGQVLKIKKKS
ncbi:MAG TPA: lytic transglycosylase [Bacteroidales bacterium]|nr:MAG: hypothetical protein A2W98_04100 [Bacteroidetes bacterium GWF2_33_38]OFY76075.1 MAG: hypothetical protein A2265_05880 [Bacteroidetes bacterium RIFOXYA12_FULL_33_9]OFY88530.1 MAG: hypothetical protein A2236_11250 [Bacteroidetes bacterium RIFOXYA2_FULL_33_7]HBF88884.1 lytic transglycosylase [Bacteroidales bacterium]